MHRSQLASCVVLVSLCSAAGSSVGGPVIIGGNDGFGGTQGGVATPGQAYVNFSSPGIVPGVYVDASGMDASTVSPYSVYTFQLNFEMDLTSEPSIYRAELFVQSGSVALGAARGFGHARVRVNGVDIGAFWTVNTDPAASAAEESVKGHLFDVTAHVAAGQLNEVEVVIDGSPALAIGDQFALDFARLSIRRSCPGDVTLNGFVDFADLNLILSNFLMASDDGDSNGDGIVNFTDLNEVLSNYLTPCPDAA